MTEHEWLESTDPVPMLRFLVGKVTSRKLRLFAAACCRVVWPMMRGSARESLEVVERYAEGLATDLEVTVAKAAALAELGKWRRREGIQVYTATRAVELAAHSDAGEAARLTVQHLVYPDFKPGYETRVREIRAFHAALLREVVGNPFHCTRADAAWLHWERETIPRMARAMYEGSCFDDLPVLADALEEAGCTDESLLEHCRQPGEHVRGCWVLDLLLGKE